LQIRASVTGAGQPLTALNAIALAGRWYAWFIEERLDDLRPPEHWSSRKDVNAGRIPGQRGGVKAGHW
jgi:hypothetical protein